MIDLKQFCFFDHELLSDPFSFGEYTYATNGHVLVRVGRMDDVPENDAAMEKIVLARLPFDHDDIQCWQPLPNVDVVKYKCNECGGSCFVVDCPECEGRGGFDYETSYNDYYVYCKTCDGECFLPVNHTYSDRGENRRPCPECEGTGEIVKRVAIDVGRNDKEGLNSIYIALFSRLQNVVFSTYGECGSCVRVKFDGGVGLVMPMRMN